MSVPNEPGLQSTHDEASTPAWMAPGGHERQPVEAGAGWNRPCMQALQALPPSPVWYAPDGHGRHSACPAAC